MKNMAEIYKLTIGITLTMAFVFTVILTLASLVGWVKFRYPAQQKVLFGILVVELCSAGVAMYKDMISLSPLNTQSKIEKPLKEENKQANARVKFYLEHMKTLHVPIPSNPP